MADKNKLSKEMERILELSAVSGRKPISAEMKSVIRAGEYQDWLKNTKAGQRKAAGDRMQKFINEDLAERKAKQGETTGFGDLLTFQPAARAAKLLKGKDLAGAGLNAAAFTSQFADDPGDPSSLLAAVPRLTKLNRRRMLEDFLATATPALRARESGPVAGAKKFPAEMQVMRSENMAQLGPSSKQRRGSYYAYGSPVNELFNQAKPSGAGYKVFGPADLTKPPVEGGNVSTVGKVRVRNPLVVDSNSYLGNDAFGLIGGRGGGALGKSRSLDVANSSLAGDLRWARSLQELNKRLPRKYRLNNTDWRNFTGGQEKPWKVGSDTVGDLLLSKVAKTEGYDAIVPKAFQHNMSGSKPAGFSEVMIPSESRHALQPQWSSNLPNFMEFMKNRAGKMSPEDELIFLNQGRKPNYSGQSAGQPDVGTAPPITPPYSKWPPVPSTAPTIHDTPLGKWAAKEKTKKAAAAEPKADGFTPLFPESGFKKELEPVEKFLLDLKSANPEKYTPEQWKNLGISYPNIYDLLK